MKNKYGFILKDGSDYGLIMGKNVYFLRDGISDIEEDVEIGFDENKILDGYGFGINKMKKTWHIKDTGHHCCKKVIATGKYEEEFEKSLEPLFRYFK